MADNGDSQDDNFDCLQCAALYPGSREYLSFFFLFGFISVLFRRRKATIPSAYMQEKYNERKTN